MKVAFSAFLSLVVLCASGVTLAVEFPPPSGCAQGCDQTVGYPTSACYQCPSGGAEFLQCRYGAS